MSVQSKPFYWLVCDAPGCGKQSPGDDGEYTGWAEVEHATDYASESDWFITSGGKHFCPDHAYQYCDKCGELLSPDESDTGERTCFKCAPELVEASAARGAEEGEG